MDYHFYIKKYSYYRNWYEQLTAEERRSVIGQWIFNNCCIYHGLIQDIEKTIPRTTGGPGNYTPHVWN